MKITILTRRVSIGALLRKGLRNILRFIKYFIKGGIYDIDIIRYSGHTAVTKSLVKGLEDIKTEFVFNPIFTKNITDTVVVLSDLSALYQAVEWKKTGKIKKLIAGPSLINLPTQYNKTLSAPEIDLILVPSEMTKLIYEKLNPDLIGKIIIWYSGVDTNYWQPTNTAKERREIVVYWKNFSTAFNLEVESILKNKGYKVNRIVYGKYNKKYYKKLLEKSMFAVFLSVTETQGLALVEAWSMGVPTIVWDPEIEHYYLRNIRTTSAPYLSEKTGLRWKELDELKLLLDNDKLDLKNFSPREWVLNNMTNKKSAELLLKICKN